MANYQVWFRLNNGIWNNDPSADPVANVGGIDLSAMEGIPVSPIVQGTGDAGITANFGASPFSFPVPSGYTAGWPSNGVGFTTFNNHFGSAAISAGNLHVSFLSSQGMAQSNDQKVGGKFYFELVNPTGDIFSEFWGGGVGKDFSSGGGNYNFWFNGRFASGDVNGGALVGNQTLVYGHSDLMARGSIVVPAAFDFAINAGNVVGVAVFLSEIVPPPNATASVADLIFRPASDFFDLSVAANRRKLIDVSGCTVNPGPDGSAPFGTTPAVFLTVPQGGTLANTFATNFGSGGVFSLTGGDLALTGNAPCCSTTVIDLSPSTASTANPQVMLSISDDGGRTWSPLQKWRSMGRIGKYLTRLRWLKMGQFRQRIIKLEVTDPVRRNIIGFYEDVSEGME